MIAISNGNRSTIVRLLNLLIKQNPGMEPRSKNLRLLANQLIAYLESRPTV